MMPLCACVCAFLSLALPPLYCLELFTKFHNFSCIFFFNSTCWVGNLILIIHASLLIHDSAGYMLHWLSTKPINPGLKKVSGIPIVWGFKFPTTIPLELFAVEHSSEH
jgi:hypothetical protein